MSTSLSAAHRRPAGFRPHPFARSTLAWASCLQALIAAAQPVAPDEAATRELLRQQERARQAREEQAHGPDVRLPVQAGDADATERLPTDESPCFPIERIELAGDGAPQFQWTLPAAGRTASGEADPALHRCLGAEGIRRVMHRMQNAIVARGYITTRVLAAPQDLSSGTLVLTLVPGRVRAVRFAPGTDARATAWNAIRIAPGELLDLRDIEQALENFKRVPTAQADIQVTPAEALPGQAPPGPGESDLVVQWRQGLPFRASVSADDGGTRATGRYQGALNLSYDHWWTLNDLFYVSLLHDLGGGDAGARGTRGYSLHYSVPYGPWLLAFNSNANRYHQSVAGASQTYVYSGDSRSGDVKLSRLVYRDAVRKTTAFLRGWVRSSRNFIDGTEVEVQRRRTAGWELGAGHREFVEAATLDLNVALRRGTGAQQALPAPEDAFGEGASRPRIVLADAGLLLPWTWAGQRLRYGAAWRAQWGATALVPQDRFAIGGRYTVRGFDGENVLSAQRGWLLRNDLAWLLADSGQELYLGLDHGEVGGAGSEDLAGTRLTGAVLGLRGSWRAATWDLFVGAPLRKPQGFPTASHTGGFSATWSF